MARRPGFEVMSIEKKRLTTCAVMARHLIGGDSFLLAARKVGLCSGKIYRLCKQYEDFDELKDFYTRLKKAKRIKEKQEKEARKWS